MLTNIISFLLEWITLNTHYDASIFNFEVIELSKNELQALACGGKCPIIAFFKPEVGILISELDYKNIYQHIADILPLNFRLHNKFRNWF